MRAGLLVSKDGNEYVRSEAKVAGPWKTPKQMAAAY